MSSYDHTQTCRTLPTDIRYFLVESGGDDRSVKNIIFSFLSAFVETYKLNLSKREHLHYIIIQIVYRSILENVSVVVGAVYTLSSDNVATPCSD